MLRYDHVADISPVMETKLSALPTYRSLPRSFAYDDAVIGLDRFRGALAANCTYAEVR